MTMLHSNSVNHFICACHIFVSLISLRDSPHRTMRKRVLIVLKVLTNGCDFSMTDSVSVRRE